MTHCPPPTTNHPNALAQMVLDAYHKLPSKGKPQQKEWTVLAGLVVVWNDDRSSQVLAVTTGNRCVGHYRQGNSNTVVDCHAEILIRRCFKRFLYNELLHLKETQISEYLQPSSVAPGKYQLDSAATLHLVVSQTPCGDASIYATAALPPSSTTTATTTSTTTTSTTTTSTTTTSTIFNWTGAKPVVPTDDTRECQKVGCLRTKSSRSDALRERQTSSMCCSDKLGMWCHVGIEGALLSDFIDSVWLSSVVLVLGHMCEETREQARMSTERALLQRFQTLRHGEKNEQEGTPPPPLMRVVPIVATSSLVFERSKALVEAKTRQQLPPPSSSSSSSSSSSNATKETEERVQEPPLKRQKKKKKKKLSTPSGYAIVSVGNTFHAVLVSAKGVPQGTTETSSRPPSFISKQSFMQDYLRLKEPSGSGGGGSHPTTIQEYETIKNSVVSTPYAKRKRFFKSHTLLQHWKGNKNE
jgi:hypothetical protein